MRKITFLLGLMLTMLATNVWAVDKVIDRSGWSICAYANPGSTIEGAADGRIGAAIDGKNDTFFHSDWSGSATGNGCPQSFLIDMGTTQTISSISFLPRQNGGSVGAPVTGRIYVYTADDVPFTNYNNITADNKATQLGTETLGEATLNLSWSSTASADVRKASFSSPVTGRYILLVADETTQNGNGKFWLCCAEFNAYTSVANVEYSVVVKGCPADGAVTYGGKNYTNGQTITTSELITTSDLAVKPITDMNTTVSVDETKYVITVTYTPITIGAWEDIEDCASYYFTTKRGALCYSEGNLLGVVAPTASDWTEAAQQIIVVKSKDMDKIYMYSVAAGKFIKRNGDSKPELTNFPSEKWIIKTGKSNDYPIMIDTQSGHHWNVNNTPANTIDSYSSADDGNQFAVCKTGIDETAFYTALQQNVDSALAETFTTGESVGDYDATKVKNAKDKLSSASITNYATAIAALETYYNEIQAAVIQPEVGKTYLLVSAYPTFETTQGVKKAIYTNGNKLSWKTLNRAESAFYFEIYEIDGNNITLRSVDDFTYPQKVTANNVAIPMTDSENYCVITSLGSGQFNIKSNGSGNPFHAGNHGNGAGVSGDVVQWSGSANSCSAWYIVQADVPTIANVTYKVMDNTTELWSKTVPAIIGEPYPVVDNPNQMVILGGFPEGNVSGDATFNLTYTTKYTIIPEGETITQWYALDIRNENMPTFGQGEGEVINAAVDTDDYKNGAVKNENYGWAFISNNPFVSIKLKNQYSGLFAAKLENGGSKEVTLETEGSEFEVLAPHSTIPDGFGLKKVSDNAALNRQNNVLKSWTGFDQGSTFLAYPITKSSSEDKVGYTFSAEYGTLIVPFYAEIPEDLEVFTCSGVTGDLLTLTAETSMIKPGVPYIIKSEESSEFEFLGASKLTSPATATVGLLTGVYSATKAPADSYVLLNKSSKLGFYKVVADDEPTVGANRCYLTLPASEAKAVFFDNATAIEAIEALTSKDAKIYDLNGRELKSLQKGINIVGGKKILVK